MSAKSVPSNLADASASELLSLYASGDASPVDATLAVLDRISKCEPEINAFCLVDRQSALASAGESTVRWQEKRTLGPLDGVPVSIKDLLLTRGWPTLRGSRGVDSAQPWLDDAPVTARLRESGAVLLGKTCTPEFGLKTDTNSPLTGFTRNPWNLERSPGGSSGGAAAAVAAGMGPLAIGTDGAGSIRIPSAFCGVFGLKPSFGRVPSYPLSPFGTVGHVGPHTRSVRDAALVLNVTKRPDARDWTALPPDDSDMLSGLEAGIRGLRIAYSPRLGFVKYVHPEVEAAVERAVRDLQALGAQVELVDPGIEDPLDITSTMWFAGAMTMWHMLSPQQQALADPDFIAQAQIGEKLSLLDIQKAHIKRGALGSHMRQFMQKWDLLVTPTVPVPAFPLQAPGSVAMSPESLIGWAPFTHTFNMTQQPACSIPCGITSDGLPIGMQLIGPMFDDAVVLRAARAYETVRPIIQSPMSIKSS